MGVRQPETPSFGARTAENGFPECARLVGVFPGQTDDAGREHEQGRQQEQTLVRAPALGSVRVGSSSGRADGSAVE